VMADEEQQKLLAGLLDLCSLRQLAAVQDLISHRFKRGAW
jgi:hypothetical protein